MKTMKKLILLLLCTIISLLVASCTQVPFKATPYTRDVSKDACKLEQKRIDALDKPLEVSVLTYNSIEYLSFDDTYLLLTAVNERLKLFRLSGSKEKDMESIFDLGKGTLSINTRLGEASTYSEILWGTSVGEYFDFSSLRTGHPLILDTTYLKDFDIKSLYFKGQYYMPLSLFNYAFLSNHYLLYPSAKGNYYVLDPIDTFEDKTLEVLDANEVSLNESCSSALFAFSRNYLINYLKKYYPYYEERSAALEASFNSTLAAPATSDDYYNCISSILYAPHDNHTAIQHHSKYVTNVSQKTLIEENKRISSWDVYSEWSEEKYNNPKNEYRILENQIGYLKINDFNTLKPIDDILAQFKNCKGMILDLRDFKGGLAQYILPLVSMFMEPKEELNLYYKERIYGSVSDLKQATYKKKKGDNIEAPMVLLTNRYTYSAGNIMSGLIKDNSLGTIIGEKTLGGGSARAINVLPDGTSYYTSSSNMFTHPDGTCYEFGIEPDISMKDIIADGRDQILEKALEVLKSQLQ
ncbi:MAG: S41 family peptidase [Clostridia bacterium]|nr:S41 family peptidase [Clostridia bacterium]